MLTRRPTTAKELCTYVIGSQCGSVIFPQWEVQLPDTPKPPHVEPVLPEVSGEQRDGWREREREMKREMGRRIKMKKKGEKKR